ncbi:MAG: hypothetical protein HQ553_11615 [Chloroflexi bacterium]|nr:hypothetical protein [Chloroflexota bacterium]
MLKVHKANFLTALLVIFLFFPVVASCGPFHQRDRPSNSDNKEVAISFVAKVRWIPLEGGFYGLVADDGRRFLPLNLPDTFRKEGLKVRVRGEIKKVVTIYMWGTPFEIHEIEDYSP